jgi:hypothetical protein
MWAAAAIAAAAAGLCLHPTELSLQRRCHQPIALHQRVQLGLIAWQL